MRPPGQRFKSLDAAPIAFEDRSAIFVDLRLEGSHEWLEGSRTRMSRIESLAEAEPHTAADPGGHRSGSRLRDDLERPWRLGKETPVPQFADYDSYVRAEWRLFAASPKRQSAAREAVAGLEITRVLDLGCGAGQELRPFVSDPRSLGVGIDLSPEAGIAGRELFALEQPSSHVVFIRAAAECLPLASSSMDLIICRLVLPYTDNRRAFAEIARVLRPAGVLLLKFHHPRFYFREFRSGLAQGQIKSALHACRVLLAGSVYHVTGSQPRGRWLGRETFQTMWLIRRELTRNGLGIRSRSADSTPATPSLVIRREGSRTAGGSDAPHGHTTPAGNDVSMDAALAQPQMKPRPTESN